MREILNFASSADMPRSGEQAMLSLQRNAAYMQSNLSSGGTDTAISDEVVGDLLRWLDFLTDEQLQNPDVPREHADVNDFFFRLFDVIGTHCPALSDLFAFKKEIILNDIPNSADPPDDYSLTLSTKHALTPAEQLTAILSPDGMTENVAFEKTKTRITLPSSNLLVYVDRVAWLRNTSGSTRASTGAKTRSTTSLQSKRGVSKKSTKSHVLPFVVRGPNGVYVLWAVITHSGSAHRGHFFTSTSALILFDDQLLHPKKLSRALFWKNYVHGSQFMYSWIKDDGICALHSLTTHICYLS